MFLVPQPHPSPPLPATPPKPDILRGWIKTTRDAILVFEATRAGLVPRVTRRFHELEKRSIIQSGAVLVFTEEESGIKRWTDPYVWSASRMQGNFLMYREREDEHASEGNSPYRCSAVVPPSDRGSPETCPDPELEHYILGSWNKGKGLKKNGLMKKTISMSIEGTVYHLISYYYPSDVRSGVLQTPSQMPKLANLEIGPAILESLSQFRQPPSVGKPKRGRPPRSRNATKDMRPTGLSLDIPSPPSLSYPSPIDIPSSQESAFDPSTPSDVSGSWSSPRPHPCDTISSSIYRSLQPLGPTHPGPASFPPHRELYHHAQHHQARTPGLAYTHSHIPYVPAAVSRLYDDALRPTGPPSPWHISPMSEHMPSPPPVRPQAKYELGYEDQDPPGMLPEYEIPLLRPKLEMELETEMRARQDAMRTWQPVIEEARLMAPASSAAAATATTTTRTNKAGAQPDEGGSSAAVAVPAIVQYYVAAPMYYL